MLEGAVKVKETVVALVTVAVPTTGAVGAAFVPDPWDPKIGIIKPLQYVQRYYTPTNKSLHLILVLGDNYFWAQ